MMVLDIGNIKSIIKKVGIDNFFLGVAARIESDFARWSEFSKSSRHAIYSSEGVIELMPIADRENYSFKYVNGHPLNPQKNRLAVVAFGMLSSVKDGYPLMLSEMTILTAIRTAVTAAISSKYLSSSSNKLAIIGCGAQSEFQIIAHNAILGLNKISALDLRPESALKLQKNLATYGLDIAITKNSKECIEDADIIVTATAAPGKNNVLGNAVPKAGSHICGIGGDSVGKTELDVALVEKCKIVVEFFEQTLHEGEIQNLGSKAKELVYAELWELISGVKKGRENQEEITLFDSVGFALEDYSILQYVYSLAQEHGLYQTIDLIPEKIEDFRNLYSII